jgi:hypothetical protein
MVFCGKCNVIIQRVLKMLCISLLPKYIKLISVGDLLHVFTYANVGQRLHH